MAVAGIWLSSSPSLWRFAGGGTFGVSAPFRNAESKLTHYRKPHVASRASAELDAASA
jgi:hypothetical protein